jgi:Zn-dependent protease with chaperone function
MKISTKKQPWIRQLFSSHPDIDERIKRLENLSI